MKDSVPNQILLAELLVDRTEASLCFGTTNRPVSASEEPNADVAVLATSEKANGDLR
jgi:hypothetical protein